MLLYGHVDLELAEQIQGLPKAWGPMPYKKTAATPSHGTPAESDDITGGIGYEGLARIEAFVEEGGLLVTLGSGSMLALEGGIVRGVRRVAGGVPRSTDGDGGASSSASSRGPTRTPGAHVRVSVRAARPPDRVRLSRSGPTSSAQNFPLYDAPRAWLRMAYCTSCLDGPEDRSGIVLEWGDREGAPFVVSGQAWGEEALVGRPAILDLPAGRGHVVAFNFNPLHRDLNRGDHRLRLERDPELAGDHRGRLRSLVGTAGAASPHGDSRHRGGGTTTGSVPGARRPGTGCCGRSRRRHSREAPRRTSRTRRGRHPGPGGRGAPGWPGSG